MVLNVFLISIIPYIVLLFEMLLCNVITSKALKEFKKFNTQQAALVLMLLTIFCIFIYMCFFYQNPVISAVELSTIEANKSIEQLRTGVIPNKEILWDYRIITLVSISLVAILMIPFLVYYFPAILYFVSEFPQLSLLNYFLSYQTLRFLSNYLFFPYWRIENWWFALSLSAKAPLIKMMTCSAIVLEIIFCLIAFQFSSSIEHTFQFYYALYKSFFPGIDISILGSKPSLPDGSSLGDASNSSTIPEKQPAEEDNSWGIYLGYYCLLIGVTFGLGLIGYYSCK